jgi:hypothetical protein
VGGGAGDHHFPAALAKAVDALLGVFPLRELRAVKAGTSATTSGSIRSGHFLIGDYLICVRVGADCFSSVLPRTPKPPFAPE